MSGRIAIPIPLGSSGVAEKAASRLPSSASSTRSSCETAAPESTGIGGSESESKHIGPSLQREPFAPVAHAEQAL